MTTRAKKTGWIGVDLDGTLAHYDHWVSHTHIGAPIPEMVERVKRWLAEGYTVRVFTARMSEPNARMRAEVLTEIYLWTEQHIGTRLEATCMKDYAMLELWDDRAVTVEMNTGRALAWSLRGLDADMQGLNKT